MTLKNDEEFGSAEALRAEETADPTKLTVNLTPRSMTALNETAARLGDSRTDTVNRALQLYAELADLEVGQGFTYEVRGGQLVTVMRVPRVNAWRHLRVSAEERSDDTKESLRFDPKSGSVIMPEHW